MPEKKHPEKITLLPELEKSITEILVAHGRSTEPFIKTFSYTGENITKLGLGTLVGVFEVDEKSEDSAYIVNFLASVAKKEYFNNSRRGAVESFEASLHKINLALAELVKHGNVGWLGKFHGTLGVFEKNNFHFSATGEAKIILLRNDSISDIAFGLASEESHIHPIKTFIEVSSGRLMSGDKVILSAPELFRLFSFEDLRKNALRMDKERFTQFLKTALVNELDMTGVIVADIKETQTSPIRQATQKEKKSEVDSQKTIANVFSQAAFVTDKKEDSIEQSLLQKEAPPTSEYIDSKTGHIYIQGDTPKEPSSHPLLEKFTLLIQESGRSLRVSMVSQGKWLRKIKKQSSITLDTISEEASIASRKTLRALRKQWHERTKNTSAPTEVSTTLTTKLNIHPLTIPQPKKTTTPPQAPKATPLRIPEPLPETRATKKEARDAISEASKESNNDIPPFIKAKLAAFYKKGAEIPSEPIFSLTTTEKTNKNYSQLFSQKITLLHHAAHKVIRIATRFLRQSWGLIKHMSKAITENGSLFYGRLSSGHKKIVIGVVAIFLLLISASVFIIFRQSTAAPAPTVESPSQSTHIADTLFTQNDKNAQEATPTLITTSSSLPIDSVFLDGALYLISPNSIIDIHADKSYSLPSGIGKPKFVSAMDDLRLVFLYTEQGELFAWSPISKTFVKNTLDLPSGAKVQSMGTYLTYLYILDSTSSQIYRFPRADGGFGTPTNWLRDVATFGENSHMAINETLFLTSEKTTIQAFFRGRFVKNLESLHTPLAVASLYTHPGLAYVYALDTDHKRVVVWDQEGNLIAQYFDEKLGEATTLTVNEANKEVFFTVENSLFSFKVTIP